MLEDLFPLDGEDDEDEMNAEVLLLAICGPFVEEGVE